MKAISNPIVNAHIAGVRFKRRNALSKYYGVTWNKKSSLWHARFIYSDANGKRQYKHLGTFQNERDAAIAYDKMAIHFNLPTNILKRHENPVNNTESKDYGKTN